jgi:hypothetical protein
MPDFYSRHLETRTDYSGELEGVGTDHYVCRWTWEAVSELNIEIMTGLIQFVTGDPDVHWRGLAALWDEGHRKLTIHGVPLNICKLPCGQRVSCGEFVF